MSQLTALDLFSGAGGATEGLRAAGFDVLAAIESEPDAARSFALNHPETELLIRDIRRVQAPAFARRLALSTERLTLLTACPPCQPFSTLGTGRTNDPRNALVSSVLRFVDHLHPRAVVLENVPGLQREPRFMHLVRALARRNYEVGEYLVQAADFGVPQSRRRVIVVAVENHIGTALPARLVEALPLTFDSKPQTAGDVLRLTKRLEQARDPLHRGRRLEPTTLARIKAIPAGGSRAHLPEALQLDCHKRLSTSAATSIYGRIDGSRPAPTMTTRCTTPSCGRFVHPDEDRGLTLREAAMLQTFPPRYRFSGSYGSIERQIGNAVPPKLAQALGEIVAALLDTGSHERAPQAA